MFYLIQRDIFGDVHLQELLHTLERLGLEHEICRLLPFVDEIEFETERRDVFCFGAVKMARVAKMYQFYPGSLFNDNHDFEVYGKKYGELMLNHDNVVMKATDELPADLPFMFFARPTKDNKMFNGGVFTHHSWKEMIENIRESKHEKVQETLENNVMMSPMKEIKWEVRCFVVGGKVITMSQYKLGRMIIYKNMDSEEWLRDIVQSYVDIYQPSEGFVMDVCELGDISEHNIKIVEINCLNCSGFYHVNLPLLINALEEKFN